jgi:ADP-heptose:LPS heptosyltransferase
MPSGASLTRLGYDTRSWRSAIVMRAIDAINPFKREQEFAWTGPCVISSIAGLGDLFIHLPLIAGLVNECRRRDIQVRVALRPAHLEIGKRCGWELLPFDNALEDFFKNPRALRPLNSLGRVRGTRINRPQLWIDLTGNAISALAIKLAGAKTLAARVTRGGRSLINYPLPHAIQENEYANRDRVAKHLGARLDFSVAEDLRGDPIPDLAGTVVVCLTTAARWKNWPLRNFRTLLAAFPNTRFVLTGFRRELTDDDTSQLEAMLHHPNVVNGLDRFSADQLVRLIAHARAVVTNDTSAAHIANLFGVSGAVLFGPVSPGTFAAPAGLKVFHDATCPYHPCVQWKCSNEANWCMEKISPDTVGDHLAKVLGLPNEHTLADVVN